MPRMRDYTIIGVGSHVVAVDPMSGDEAWRTKLKTSGFVTVSVSGNRVLAGAGGELFCLDRSTGEMIWRNKLKGLGLGVIAFPGDSGLVSEALAESQRRTTGAGGG
jgi:outer membrane protein assembly factor BamB